MDATLDVSERTVFRAERRYSEVGVEMLHYRHVLNVRGEDYRPREQRPQGYSVPTTCSASLQGTGGGNCTD